MASQQRVELADRFVARGEAVAQLLLLPIQLLGQRPLFRLQLPQAPDVRPVGGADEMRQHVHVLECLLHDRLGRGGVTQQRPVCTRDVAAAHRLVPELPQRLLILGLSILLDREGVAAVERPLQHLRTGVAATGQHDADHVQLVVVGGLYSVHAQARQRVTQLGVRQAGSDDRAVQRVRQLPDLAASRRLRGRGVGRRVCPQQDVGASIEPDQRRQRGGGAKIVRNGRQQRHDPGSLYLFEYSEYGPGAAPLERGKFAAGRGSVLLICSVVYSGGAARTGARLRTDSRGAAEAWPGRAPDSQIDVNRSRSSHRRP